MLLLLHSAALGQLLAQELTPIFKLKTKKYSDFLLLTDASKITLHTWGNESLLSLYSSENMLLDQYKIEEDEKPILTTLGNDRYFLQSGNFSYNFRVANDKIIIEKKVEIPVGPKGTVERIYFFDRAKSVSVFLNEFEQANVYVDSAGVRLTKNEKYNTNHLRGISEFTKRPETTSKIIYSMWSKELFFHMPTDASFLSVNLKSNKISIGFIYMEYNQKYTFRRYFDELSDNLYVLEELGTLSPKLFSVSSFGVAVFSEESEKVHKPQIGFTPSRIINGKLLYKKIEKQGDFFNHEYYLFSPNEAISRGLIKKK